MEQIVVVTPNASLAVRQSRLDGEPLLLLHGGPGGPDAMQTSIAPMLAEFRCISFDQRGVGESVCHDGRYALSAYLEDIEAIRGRMGIASWHVMGHSWGGLLAQAYTETYPQRVKSLLLSSSSLGVGGEWKRTKREAFHTGRKRAGFWGNLRFLAYGLWLVVPGKIGRWSMRHVMTETWHNYFLKPDSAPDPDKSWLSGCSAEAMIKTDREVSKLSSDVLPVVSNYEGPVLVLYGVFDIFGEGTGIVRRRFPQAVQVTLEGSGHLHWLQHPRNYANVLHNFYDQAEGRGRS